MEDGGWRMEDDRTRMYVSLAERFHQHQLLQYSIKGKDIREGPSDWETINRMISMTVG
jgi:hypothetical protein